MKAVFLAFTTIAKGVCCGRPENFRLPLVPDFRTALPLDTNYRRQLFPKGRQGPEELTPVWAVSGRPLPGDSFLVYETLKDLLSVLKGGQLEPASGRDRLEAWGLLGQKREVTMDRLKSCREMLEEELQVLPLSSLKRRGFGTFARREGRVVAELDNEKTYLLGVDAMAAVVRPVPTLLTAWIEVKRLKFAAYLVRYANYYERVSLRYTFSDGRTTRTVSGLNEIPPELVEELDAEGEMIVVPAAAMFPPHLAVAAFFAPNPDLSVQKGLWEDPPDIFPESADFGRFHLVPSCLPVPLRPSLTVLPEPVSRQAWDWYRARQMDLHRPLLERLGLFPPEGVFLCEKRVRQAVP